MRCRKLLDGAPVGEVGNHVDIMDAKVDDYSGIHDSSGVRSHAKGAYGAELAIAAVDNEFLQFPDDRIEARRYGRP